MKNEGSDGKIIALCVAISIAIFVLDSSIELGVAGGVPYVLVVLISHWSYRKKLPVYMAIAGSILTVVGFYTSPYGGELWKVIFNRALALFAIWVTAIVSSKMKTMFEEKESALSEVKILRGIVPICMHCKEIRDDKGYWNQLEKYISEHSEAEFSHGICGRCRKSHYP